MKKLSLKFKLVLLFMLAALIPMMFVSFYSYNQTKHALQEKAIEKLVATRSIKADAVKRYFENIRDQVITFSHDLMIREAMLDFSTSYDSFVKDNRITKKDISIMDNKLLKFYESEFSKKYSDDNGKRIDSSVFLKQLTDTQVALQYFYVANNPNPLGQKEKLDSAQDKSSYSSAHAKYHPVIRKFLQKFGYYDIFLVDIDTGNIVYSVFKELDFSTSLTHGPYKDTNFAEAFDKAKNLNKIDEYVLVDYKKYAPSYDAPASFIATPIWNEGKKIGVLMFQMPIDRLNLIMSERSGMGKTGEIYLFGQDKLMRSDSFLDKKIIMLYHHLKCQRLER